MTTSDPNQLWNDQHAKYADTAWINKPTIFAEQALAYFPEKGKLLDVGCGQGQDSRYYAEHGYEVVGIDFSEEGLKFAREKSRAVKGSIVFEKVDISQTLPFASDSFDIVYTHLSSHYFDDVGTERLFREYTRILKLGGILAVLVNSVHDPEYASGETIGSDYRLIRGMKKHFFSAESLATYANGFEVLINDEKGETYKDRALNTHNLVRFVGKRRDK